VKKGSITVFSALCMSFVFSALFVLLEAARFYGLSQYADWKGRQGVECVAAEYQPYLWEEFHLLMLDGGYSTDFFEIGNVTGRMKEKLDENLNQKNFGWQFPDMNLFQMETSHIYEPKYLLVTDADGEVLLDMISAYMKKNLPREAAEEIRQRYINQNDMKNNTTNVEETIDQAKESIESARAEKEKIEKAKTDNGKAENGRQENESIVNRTNEKDTQPLEENPLDVVNEIRKSMSLSTLGLVVENAGEISTKRMNLAEAIEKRTCSEGNINYEAESDWYRKILVLEYAESNFSNYCSPKENHAYSYELEYLIGGQEEERKNLEEVVNRLLLYRCASNVTYLLSDREKMLQSETIAAALAGFTGNPAIIKTVQIAVVGAWAYIESIQDIRALLMGGKIALVKSKEQWTTDLSHLLQSFQSQTRAKECSNGLKYQDYLKQILFFAKDGTLSCRMLNVMEQDLIQNEEYKDCRMDHMIVCFRCEVEFAAEPLFSRLSFINSEKLKQYSFRRENQINYIP
jgi:hypothetical protein